MKNLFQWIICGLIAGACLLHAEDLEEPIAQRVTRLLDQLDSLGNNHFPPRSLALNSLSELGTNAYPYLRLVLSRRDEALDRYYQNHWPQLPDAIRKLLGVPKSKTELRAKAAVALSELGPEACRALCGVVAEEIENPVKDEKSTSSFMLRALYWSLPDSPRAIAALTNYLEGSNNVILFADSMSTNVWPGLPMAVPGLIAWLKKPDSTKEAVVALGLLGTNALPALPALIEVARQGAAGQPPNLKLAFGYAPHIHPLRNNRLAALNTLGTFGIASPPVVAALTNALGAFEEQVRVAGFVALSRLPGQQIEPYIQPLLDSLGVRRTGAFASVLANLSSVGDRMRPALPWFRKMSHLEYIASLPAENDPVESDYPVTVESFHWTTLLALGRIAPEELRPYLDEIVKNLGTDWSLPEYLPLLMPLPSELEPKLRLALQQTNKLGAAATAMTLLGINSRDAEARQVLVGQMQSAPTLMERWQAAWYLWKATKDTEAVLPIYQEMLRSPSPENHAPPLSNGLAEMGPAARAIAPELRQLLHDPQKWVRQQAGQCLRAIAPDQLPPVDERN